LRKNALLITASLLCLTLLLSPIFTAFTTAIPVGNRLREHVVWDPDPTVLDWVSGHPMGYHEDQTAAFRVAIDNVATGQYY
jgi:hypothetical protein